MSQFIGSKISLFSNSDIRYVGVLHDISSEDSTLTLKDVVSFGTEGRRGDPANEVPARDHVYDFIVFRGSEVKDLVIEDEESNSVPKQPPPPIVDDPAIIQGAAPPAGFPQSQIPYPQQQQQQQQQQQPGIVPPYYPQPFYSYQQSPLLGFEQPPAVPQLPMQPNVPQNVHTQAPLQNGIQQKAPMRQPAGPPSAVSGSHEGKIEGVAGKFVPAVPVPKPRQVQKSAFSKAEQVTEPVNVADDLAKKLALASVSDEPAKPAAPVRTPQGPPQTASLRGGPTTVSRGFRQFNSRGGFNNRRGGFGGAKLQVPSSDFDFEESNAKFSKDELLKEVQGSEEQEAEETEATEVYYNKSSSFFDNISSSSRDRQDPTTGERLARSEERKLNLETFGQASIDSGRFRGRGRGRGRGGYYGRGRGGGGYNNYRGGFRQQQHQQQTPADQSQQRIQA
ncbi:Scd6-like Sm domain-containing protein [Dipodascopsis uninucleata]